MSKKSQGGRPAIKSWDAMLLYQVWDFDNQQFGRPNQLMNEIDGGKSMYFENSDSATKALEALQIEKKVRYTILVRLYDEYTIMTPSAPTTITFTHEPEVYEEENEESIDDDVTIDEIPDVGEDD